MASLTVKLPDDYVEWLTDHHWEAKQSRAAYAASLLMTAIDAARTDTSAE